MTGYTYDEKGNRTSTVYPDGASEMFMYDEHGRLMMTVNPGGEKRLYVYRKDKNFLGSIIEPDNSITAFGYNERNLVNEIRHNGEAIRLEYDEWNNLTYLRDSKGVATHWLYDYRSNVVGIENPAGGYQKFEYDALNRVTAINSNGNLTEFRYNAYEEILEASDRNRKVEFAYTPPWQPYPAQGERHRNPFRLRPHGAAALPDQRAPGAIHFHTQPAWRHHKGVGIRQHRARIPARPRRKGGEGAPSGQPLHGVCIRPERTD